MSSDNQKRIRIPEHRIVFMMMMASFFVAPYVVATLRIPYSKFDYPDIWLWGLLLFGIVSYIMGSIFSRGGQVIGVILNNQGKLRTIALCFVVTLSSLYFTRLGLHFVQSILGSVFFLAFWAILLRRRFDQWTSILLSAASSVAIALTFVVMGGVPLLDPAILESAKLSPARELALPLFLLGAISFFFNATVRGGVVPYALSLAVFAIGGLVFLLNGDMHDFLAILVACLLALLSRFSRRQKIVTIGSLALIGLFVSYLMPTVLGLFRQSFNLQVLRHIVLLVEDPITGLTKGAISFGLRSDFLGAHLIYGEDQNWTLTSTWLGPAYLDLGLIGVFLTMFTLGAILESMVQVLDMSESNINLATLYLAALSIVISLFEDGASLPVAIFLLLVTYGTLCQLPKDRSSRLDLKRGISQRGFVISILVISLLGLGASAYAYCSEFGGFRRSVEMESITQQRTHVALILEPNRFYHARIVGPGTICLDGELAVVSETDGTRKTLKNIVFNGCLWVAKVDQIDLGWFRTEEHESKYAVVLDLGEPPGRSSQLCLQIETSNLSFWITNETAIQSGMGINAIAITLLAIYGEYSGYHPRRQDLEDGRSRPAILLPPAT